MYVAIKNNNNKYIHVKIHESNNHTFAKLSFYRDKRRGTVLGGGGSANGCIFACTSAPFCSYAAMTPGSFLGLRGILLKYAGTSFT